MDFVRPAKERKNGVVEIYPNFRVCKSKDLMIRGGDFYAIWDEEAGMWSTDEDTAIRLIDKEIAEYTSEYKNKNPEAAVHANYIRDAKTKLIDSFHHYVQKQMKDNYKTLDDKLIFANTEVRREDYVSHRLPYPLEPGDYSAFDELMSVLYSEEERRKIEWAIGSIVCGDSKKIQKFIVLTGDAGTGKSTVIKIIKMLFDGYWATIDAKAIGSSTAAFALEPLKKNPLVAIQDDADLSRIQDNTRLNSLISHESLSVNEKFKSLYETSYHCFIFLGSNGDVNITDAQSGLQRRLIDVRPTNMTLPFSRYLELMERIKFELGGIAFHCWDVYKADKHRYDKYLPAQSLRNTNSFYNFMEENYFEYENGVKLIDIWEDYKKFCDDAALVHRMTKLQVKKELMAYFRKFRPECRLDDGSHVYNYYSDIRKEKFGLESREVNYIPDAKKPNFLDLREQPSLLDEAFADCPAQLANTEEHPSYKWKNCTTKLKDIDTHRLHYVKPPSSNYIVIDFDLKDENGNKSFEQNLEAASKWPATYAETSKSGEGIHLTYIYKGDVDKLSRIYDNDIEVKIFTGDSSLRRKLSRCNNVPIATINSGLPLKGEKPVINGEVVKSEKGLRNLINRNLNKEIHPNTAPSVDFIFKILEDAYDSGLEYDVTDMRPAVLAFANNSSHQANKCVKTVNNMKFCSEKRSDNVESKDEEIIFFDVEVFSNLFVVVWKSKDKLPVKMINPSSDDIHELCKKRLIGFNNRKYDNHILYARLQGYTNEELYRLSQRIIGGSSNAMFKEAYNLSYTDIYDFCSKKQSLKKWEIELGIHHQELGLKWDEPVPENLWEKVADYCVNDVIATEAVFNARHDDFVAREILADIAGMTVNDTTNTLTTRIIFGNDRNPQSQFYYRDLSKPVKELPKEAIDILKSWGAQIPFDDKSLLPYFPGYKFEFGKSTYRGEEVGEGGYVYAEVGMEADVDVEDSTSHHPTSLWNELHFGIKYTKRFKDILDTRVLIKHKDFDTARKLFDGKLERYLEDEEQAAMLAQALKIAINSVYGLTSAKFSNPMKDPRNVDNFVAKRGALFMIDLKHAVQEKGFRVSHIKTDSIKIPNPTPEIIQFVRDFGKRYGYSFETEDVYDRMCLVNDAVYIAKYKEPHKDKKTGKDIWWSATGAQFAHPYVFKKLFSKEEVEFQDLCETKSVSTALYLDMNEGMKDDEHDYVFIGKTGSFCPIKDGCGGGILLREKDGKYYAATGSKGYRWSESETVKALGKENDINMDYFNKLADESSDSISEYGDFYKFVSDDPLDISKNEPDPLQKWVDINSDELPF